MSAEEEGPWPQQHSHRAGLTLPRAPAAREGVLVTMTPNTHPP